MALRITSAELAHAGTVSITKTEPPVIVAPAGVFFEATSQSGFTGLSTAPTGTGYEPEYHEITYIWTVRGSPLSAFTAPVNMVSGWNNPNVAYGPKVAFCFPDPGSYDVDLWCVGPNGETAVSTASVTVLDPDTVYSGTNTIAYDETATYTGKPTGAQEVSTWSALETAIGAASAPVRIVFPRGQTSTATSQILMSATGDYLNHIGAYGTGAKPIIDSTLLSKSSGVFKYSGSSGGTVSNSTEYVNVADIDWRGSWNAEHEIGIPGGSPFDIGDERGDTFFTIWNCDWSGLDWFEMHHSQPASATVNVVTANCTGTNWRNYGYYGNGTNTALIGCAIYQNVNAYNGGPTSTTPSIDGARNGLANAHGPVRWPGNTGDFFYVAMNDLFSRNGWSVGGGSPAQADQAVIRAFQDGTAGYSNFDRNVLEGGLGALALTTEAAGVTENPGNHLIDRALVISSPKNYEGYFYLEYGGTTIRNSYGYTPNTASYQTGSAWCIQTRSQAPSANNLAGPMRFYGNTFYNARSAANDPGQSYNLITATNTFTNVTNNNNIVYAPNIDTPVTLPDANTDVATSTISGVTLRFKGPVYYPAEGFIEGTLASTVANGGSFTVSYPSGTTQSTWTTREAAGDTSHAIHLGVEQSGNNWYVDNSTLAITFGASNITVTNNSGTSWTGGTAYFLKFDLSSDKPAFDTTYDQSGQSVPLPFPDTGSAALNPGSGLFPYDDFVTPGSSSVSRGNSPDGGAVQVT